jgi:hypothetical protein
MDQGANKVNKTSAVRAISEHGLKNVIERIWEGPESSNDGSK